jgi:hypothetical protein
MNPMKHHEIRYEPRGSRRAFLAGAALGAAGTGLAAWGAWDLGLRGKLGGQAEIGAGSRALGMPGPYPGRVVEVQHPGAVLAEKRNGYTRRDEDVVETMVARGMHEMVGASDEVEAWRSLFHPGDRVGIKVVPVGKPDSISSYELVRALVAGLESAGVRRADILVFERYKHEFLQCGYHSQLPEGVHWECCSARYDDLQLELDGQLPKSGVREKRVAGYDRDIFRELAYCQPECDPADDRRFRSHLSQIISRKVDKFISIPVLKDHRSGGVTLSLKNLSHGSVNNVARSHISPALNQCGEFIPAIASLPALREKAVLQVLDGLVATYEGGPGIWNKTFATWNYGSLFFATDPVALDQVGWEIIDAKRVAEGLPRIAAMGLEASTGVIQVEGKPYPEQFFIRQPQHVPLAATLGLGVFDPSHKKIDHRRIELA